MNQKEKLQLFKTLFRGRSDCHGAGEGRCVKLPLTDAALGKHLRGLERVGVYLLTKENRVHCVVIDIDRVDIEAVEAILAAAHSYGVSIYVEASKSKGHHLWIFFQDTVEAAKARALVYQILEDASVNDVEVFPKQDALSQQTPYGNYINLPLFGKENVKAGKTAFLDIKAGYTPYEDQWSLLQSIQKLSADALDGLIEMNHMQIAGGTGSEANTTEPLGAAENSLTMVVEDGPRAEADVVINNCAFIQHCRDHATELKEPLWYCMVTNLVGLEGGRELIHMLSEPYPGYSHEETEKKIEHGLKDSPGPHTCESIREAGFDCQQNCDVKAPAGLAYRYCDDTPMLPVIHQQLVNDYMAMFDGVTEAPAAYHLFCFATSVGMMLERMVHIKYPHEVYPNIFCLLIGRSGYARKESATRFGKKLTAEISDVQILPALASWEGLLEAMRNPLEEGDGLKHENTLVALSEFDALLKKAKNDSVSNLIPNLCEIYDCPPEARTPTRSNPLKIEKPFVSILGGIQPEAVKQVFRGYDIHGGFCGRFMYVRGRVKKPNPWPDSVDTQAWKSIVDRLIAVRNEWVKRAAGTDSGSVELKLSDEARDIWNDFYMWHRAQNRDSELLATLTVRIPDQALKLAMIFAALTGVYKIEGYMLEDAIAIGKWLMDNTRQLFREFGQSEAEKVERRIVEMLDKNADGDTRRNIQRSCHCAAKVFGEAVSNLLSAGMIEEVRNGKKKIIRLAD